MSQLSERHLAQLIRRKMIQKVKESKKTYTRKQKHKNNDCSKREQAD